MIKRLWQDQAGAIVSAELVLISTVFVIGVVAGLTAVRDAVVSELADVAAAISALDQSYQVRGISSSSAATAPSQYLDQLDAGDVAGVTTAPRCVRICGAVFDGADGG